ncbi:MAG: PQQ-binding-like beta-propeller repeat protein, partial [Novosphingobium sp.]
MKALCARLVGVLLVLIGLAVAIGGGMLISLGGSPYYLLGGAAVLASGLGLWSRKAWSGWVYGAFLAITMLWALWEVGLDGWQLTARIIGPALFGLFFALPWIRREIGKSGWAASGAGVAGFLLVLIASLQSPMDVAASHSPSVKPVEIAGKPGEWSAWGRDKAGTRFSPLEQITPANVDRLELAWEFDTGYDPMSDTAPSPLQATPLMVDDRLFLCTQTNVVIALDPDTGKELWRFDPKVNSQGGTAVRTCRGVAYYESANAGETCAHRIITSTFNAQLIALDSLTGKPCANFGTNGIVDLKQGMGDVLPGFYYVSSAPTIARGTIILGGWVMDNVATDEPSGVIRGFDAETGKFRWAWDAGNPANSKGPAEGEWYTRSTPNSWAPMSVDEDLGLVYVPTGNPAPDYFGGLRSEASEKFGSSVVALDAETGASRWHFQTAHHDLWDYDVA